MLSFRDEALGRHRFACFRDGRLVGALFVDRQPFAADRSWLSRQLAESISGSEQLRVLSGRAGAGRADDGATVCVCFGVGEGRIAALVADGAATVAAIGASCGAGTNCGSCRPELRRLIDAHRFQKAG